MYMRLKHLWSAPAQHAGIVCIPSATRPRRAAYFSDGTTRGSRSWPPRWPRGAVFALVKTRNQLSCCWSDCPQPWKSAVEWHTGHGDDGGG